MSKIAISQVKGQALYFMSTDFGMKLKLEFKQGAKLQMLCKKCKNALEENPLEKFAVSHHRCVNCKTVSLSTSPSSLDDQIAKILPILDEWIDSFKSVDSLESIFIATDLAKIVRQKLNSQTLILARLDARKKREFKKSKRKNGASARQANSDWKNKQRLDHLFY